MYKSFPHYTQFDATDCGPTCLRMIAKYYGKSYTLLRQRSFITREGVSMLGISDAAETIGFHTNGVRIIFKQEMQAVADIVTDDMRLIERLFMPIRKIFAESASK